MKTFKQNFLVLVVFAGTFFSRFKAQEKCGFIDQKGQITIPVDYDYCGAFSEGLAVFEKNTKMGYLHKNGMEVIKAQFDNCNLFHEGLAAVRNNG